MVITLENQPRMVLLDTAMVITPFEANYQVLFEIVWCPLAGVTSFKSGLLEELAW